MSLNQNLKNFYNNLFAGSARLGVLLGTLKLPWERVTPYVSAFSEELNAYQEVSLNNLGTILGLMTRGSGKDFAFRVARYMEEHGIDEDRLKRFLVRARYFEHKNLFFKIEVDSTGSIEFSYYFRRRPSLEAAYAWLKDTGVGEHDFALVEKCARILQKETVHFLAAAEKPDGESIQKLYFSQPDDGKAWLRVYDAGKVVGLNDSAWDFLKPFKSALKKKPLFFSLSFSEGKLCPGAKLDVRGVELELVDALMKKTGQFQEARDRTKLLLDTFGKKEFDYLGLRLHRDKPLTTKVYTYQQKLD